MGDHCWRLLNRELNSEIITSVHEGEAFVITYKGNWPVVQYNSLVLDLASDFVGECRRDIEEFGQVPSSFDDMLLKLNLAFKQKFGVNFPDGGISLPMNIGDIVVPIINIQKDPYISVVKSKIYAFEIAITYLKTQLSHQPQIVKKRRKRRKANIRDFHCTLTPNHLAGILKRGKQLKFFSDETDQLDFINTFTVSALKTPINWTCTVYSLNRFFQSINGEIITKINDGKWDVVSDLFLVNGKKIPFESLMNPSKGENDRLNDLDILLGLFSDSDNF